MNLKNKTKDFFKTLFPTNIEEWAVLIFFILAYGSLASVIALDYRIVFDDRIPWDAYFSFDNRAIVMTGGGFERHPLANYFFGWIREIALWVSDGKMNDVFRLVLSLFSTVAVSFSLLLVFKYLRNIIRLPLKVSLLILVFFSAFSTNILLSFTPETYTYTLFFLVLFNYYSALKIRKDQKIPLSALALSVVSVGGLTITNASKVFIPVACEKGIFKDFKKLLHAVFRCIVAVGIFLLLYLYRLNFDFQKIFDKTGEQYEKFSNPKVTPLWDMICSWFLGGNILFSNFIVRDYHNKTGFKYKALFMDVYSSWLPYLFVGILMSLLLIGFYRNFNNRLVQVLAVSFLVDVAIHCVLKFGLHTSYIYGGHFVFVYPLMLGWLFFSFKNSEKQFTFLFSAIVVMTVYLTANNYFRMTEFFDFLNTYYQ